MVFGFKEIINIKIHSKSEPSTRLNFKLNFLEVVQSIKYIKWKTLKTETTTVHEYKSEGKKDN